MTAKYRVIFAGAVLDGFELEAVKKIAEVRLKASPEQVTRLFSGRNAVLKKGLSRELGERYVAELRGIGMLVELDPEAAAAPANAIKPDTPTRPETIASNDLEKTQIANPEALARYLRDDVDISSAPTLVVPRGQVAELTRHAEAAGAAQDPGSMPTYVVPRAQLDETRRQIQQALSDSNDPANAPTLIVPRYSSEKSGIAATVIVGQGADHLRTTPSGANKKHDPERTLIANEGALEAYLAANAGSSPMGNMTSTDLTAPSTLPGHEATPTPEPTVQKAPPQGSIRPRRTESLANVVKLDAPSPHIETAAAMPSAGALRPFQAQTTENASDTTEWSSLRSDTNSDDDANASKNTFSGLSPKLQLLLAAIGAAALLALIIWLTKQLP